MTLRYSDKPQLHYGNQGSASNMWQRFPQGAQPIATAPQRTSQPIIVYEATGLPHWALHHNSAWRKLAPYRDWRTGTTSWRMDGTEISNPVAWSMPQRKA